ncbi:hypothetical protein P9112_014282 [Eukaryota sp. TZLM1-RC]
MTLGIDKFSKYPSSNHHCPYPFWFVAHLFTYFDNMALSVQHKMELMTPELSDYRDKQIFSQHEINDIVSRRQHFELQLKRRPPAKIDFLHAIRYELQLDDLRQKRKKSLSLTECPSDFAILRRIFSLFHRVTLRFGGDVTLWQSYITFCLRKGAFKRISLVFGRALALHPSSISLWLLAIQFEYHVHHSPASTRSVISHALASNPSSTVLYEEWLKMEVSLIKSMKESGRFVGDLDEGLDQLRKGEFVDKVVLQSFHSSDISKISSFELLKHYCFLVRIIELSLNQGILEDSFVSNLNKYYAFIREFFINEKHLPLVIVTAASFLSQSQLRIGLVDSQKLIDCCQELSGLISSFPVSSSLKNLVITEILDICDFHKDQVDDLPVIFLINLLENLEFGVELDSKLVNSILVFYSNSQIPVEDTLKFLEVISSKSLSTDALKLVQSTLSKFLNFDLVSEPLLSLLSRDQNGQNIGKMISTIAGYRPDHDVTIVQKCLTVLDNQSQSEIDRLRQEFERLLTTSHDIDLWMTWIRFEQMLDSSKSRLHHVVPKAIKRFPNHQKLFEKLIIKN